MKKKTLEEYLLDAEVKDIEIKKLNNNILNKQKDKTSRKMYFNQ